MPNPKGKPIMFLDSCIKDTKRADKIYVKFPFLKKDYALLKNLPVNGILLDIGSGDGRYLKRASLIRPDLKLYAIDIDIYLERITPQDLDSFIIADCTNHLPLKDESIDFVHCSSVIEHILQVSIIFKEIFRVLKKKGYAYIEAPEAKKVLIPSFGVVGTLNFYDDPTHIRPYTKESLRRLGLEAGFEEKNIKVFFDYNMFNLLSLPYTLFKSLTTWHNVYLDIVLQAFLPLNVGGIFIK
ncbi:MAG: class I SAM-dependent methyltransferase [Candidatus Omnitrophica bacterium]|nr:class I SAM-dependent methyltransferase [Candidatus Omnitrophota bacterium]